MPEPWTGNIVRDLHIYQISHAELAREMSVSPQWVSAVLNGRRTAKNAETQFRNALDNIISRKVKSINLPKGES